MQTAACFQPPLRQGPKRKHKKHGHGLQGLHRAAVRRNRRPCPEQDRNVTSCLSGHVPTEAFDEGKDVIGGLPPSERFGIGVVSINKRSDVCPKGGDAPPRLILLSVRRAKKRPTWLSHANWSGQVHVPARPFSHPSLDQCGLMRGVIVHDEMDVEFARHSGLDLVEELTEFGSTVTSLALADGSSGRNVESGEQRCDAFCSHASLRAGWPGRIASMVAAVQRPDSDFSSTHKRHRAPAARRIGHDVAHFGHEVWIVESLRPPSGAAGARRRARYVARSTPTGRWPSPCRGNSDGWRSQGNSPMSSRLRLRCGHPQPYAVPGARLVVQPSTRRSTKRRRLPSARQGPAWPPQAGEPRSKKK